MGPDRDLRRNIPTVLLVCVLALALLAALTFVNLRFCQQNPGGNDFLARWMGAHYWVTKGISPYNSRVSLASQQMIYGRPASLENGEDIAHFVYPLNSMLFFGPFGLLDYTLARAVWMTLLELCLAGAALASLRIAGWQVKPLWAASMVLFAIFWYPGLRTIVLGQFSGVNALLILLALLFIQEGRDVPAGILLALSTAKPQMTFLLLPFALLWSVSTRRFRLTWSILISLGMILVVTLALLPGWPGQFLAQLKEYTTYTDQNGSLIHETALLLPGFTLPINIVLNAILIGYLLLEWWLTLGKGARRFIWAALLTLVITNFLAVRTATPHYVALLPAFFLLFGFFAESRPRGAPLINLLGLLLLLMGQWALFVWTLSGNAESMAMYYPVPLLALLALVIVRRRISGQIEPNPAGYFKVKLT